MEAYIFLYKLLLQQVTVLKGCRRLQEVMVVQCKSTSEQHKILNDVIS
jgi:hypothetical protein